MAADPDIRTRAERAFHEYLEKVRSGEGPDPSVYAAGYDPEVAAELRRILHDYEFLRANLAGESEGRVLGDYRLLHELGRGGMGTVWEAEQRSLGRRVAVKVLHPHLGIDPVWLERFRREAQAGGRLNHPGIVAVHGVGEHEGRPFLVQELVPGSRSLADRIDAVRALPAPPATWWRECAQTFALVAEAVQVAHAAGVVHRDLKPGNVLLAESGPKVADFGLARLAEDTGLSRTGESLGTPSYMSPEQVASRRLPLDHRTDVFSLGAALYEALTLERPFAGDTREQVAQRILLEEPVAPEKLRPGVPRELGSIAMKALEKNPARRYADMAGFAADLRRHLAGEPVQARRAGPLLRLGKWARRRPAAATAVGVTAAGFTGMAVLLAIALQARGEADAETARAREEALTAERTTDFMVDLFRAGSPEETLGDDPPVSSLLESGTQRLLAGLEHEPAVRASLMVALGRVQSSRNRFEAAEALLTGALALRRETHGEADLRTFRALNALGNLRMAQARFPEAEDLYGEAQRGYDTVLGPTAPESLENRGNLSYLYFATGRVAKAEPLMRDSLEGSRQLHGEDSPIVLSARSNLFGIQIRLEQFAQAAVTGEQVLLDLRRVHPEHHPALNSHLHGLGHLYRKMKRWDDSAERYGEALAGSLIVHGEQHAATLSTRSGLGQLHYARGDYELAEAELRRCFEGRTALLGADHKDTRGAASNLVNALLKQHEFEEAESIARELLERTAADDARRGDREALLARVEKARAQG